MKNLYISFFTIILASFMNPSFGQTETSYDLTCLSNSFHIDFPYSTHRTYCDNGIMTIDTLDPCKDFYYENGIGLYSVLYNTSDDNGQLGTLEFGDLFIHEESLFNQPESKIIELIRARIAIQFPEGEEVNSIAFDIEDISEGGIRFQPSFIGLPNEYNLISDIVEINDSMNISMIGNRVYVQGFIDGFHIGGDHIKVGNIVFNETPETPLSTAVVESSELAVFPNPVQDVLNINCKNIVTKNVRVFDTQGSLVLNITQPKFSHQVNMSNWSSGMYMTEIELENGERFFQKVVKR